jgi:hypothetical protein
MGLGQWRGPYLQKTCHCRSGATRAALHRTGRYPDTSTYFKIVRFETQKIQNCDLLPFRPAGRNADSACPLAAQRISDKKLKVLSPDDIVLSYE